MLAPLRKIEAEDAPNYQAAMLAWAGKEAMYASQMKAYREFYESPEGQMPNSVPPEVKPLPPKPEPLRLTVNDITSQKIVRLAEGLPKGVLMVLDEMNSWLHKITDGRNTEDRGCWIQGYETGPYTMDRVGGGTIHADNFAVSIYGNCQPTVFRENLSANASDGIMQRFLPVVVNKSRNVMWHDSLPDFLSMRRDYDTLLREVHSLPQFEYTMMPEAMQLFREFCQFCLDFRKREDVLNRSLPYRTALGKLEGQCARLILLCHLATNPGCLLIDEATAHKAIELMATYFLPMLRHTYLEIAAERDGIAESIFDGLLQQSGVKETVSLSEVRRLARGKNIEMMRPYEVEMLIRAAMDDLAALNHVMLVQEHPRNPIWAINPQLAVTFRTDRERIIAARQSSIEKLRAGVRRDKGAEARVGDAVGWATIPPERQAELKSAGVLEQSG
jgi:hypothetical protein